MPWPLFDKNIRLEHLAASRPVLAFAKPAPEGIRLSDESESNYAAVYINRTSMVLDTKCLFARKLEPPVS
jgi:hypothetical protein